MLALRNRLAGIAIVVATAGGILLSQYMVWSVVCGDTIEGVQGRYFLPVMPLLLLAIGFPASRLRLDARVFVAIAALCNAVAFVAMIRRYWI
jgi:uncharacterized membrane protein